MSENLSSAIKAGEELDERLNTPIPQHIQSIEIVFKRKFFELREQEVAFAQNQFSTGLNVSDISNELQDQFHEHQNYSSARDFFKNGYSLCSSVLSIQTGFSTITFMCHNILCLCKSGFSALVHVKNESTKSKESWKEYKNGFIEH